MLITLLILLSFILICVFCCLDLTKKIKLESPFLLTLYFIFMPHLPVFLYCLTIAKKLNFAESITLWVSFVILQLYSTLRLHFYPFRYNESGSPRLGILYGGRLLIKSSVLGMVLQLFYYILFFQTKWFPIPLHDTKVVVFDTIYTFCFLYLFILNGTLRILFTCKRLGIVKRFLICINMWIPILNLIFLHYMCRLTKDEYDLAVFRNTMTEIRKDSNICATKYPIIFVHGIGFRDLKYFNYWGRIPRELKKNGSIVYYGHQKAWGTIEENASILVATIEKALEETGASKVNIIAHSKGGLDSRYAISHLHMADKVASLTTISTPHRGSKLIDVLNHLPDFLYRFIAGIINRSAQQIGDEHPDCYHSSKQLAPSYLNTFNEENKDAPNVYYQSYASTMKNLFSHTLLAIPYLVMCMVDSKYNDGLVTIESAKWGNFKGTFQNKRNRGISHGDMIDLKREDYSGFDVIESYIRIVEELKKLGY